MMSFADPDWKFQHYRVEKIVEEFENFYKKEKTMDKRDNITNIVIEGDGKKTVALVASDKNGRIVETVSAHCAPEDVYNFNIGAKLALDRLYEGYDMTPKPKRRLYNGLIYIEKYPGAALKDKSIYRVEGGVIQKCMFGKRPFIYEGMSDEELSTEIDDVVWGRNDFSSYLAPGEENKFPLTVAHFIDNDKT